MLPLQPLTNLYRPRTVLPPCFPYIPLPTCTAPVPFCPHASLTTPYQPVPPPYRFACIWYLPIILAKAILPVFNTYQPYLQMLFCLYLILTSHTCQCYVCLYFVLTNHSCQRDFCLYLILTNHSCQCHFCLYFVLTNHTCQCQFCSIHVPLQSAWCQFPVVLFVLSPYEEQSISKMFCRKFMMICPSFFFLFSMF